MRGMMYISILVLIFRFVVMLGVGILPVAPSCFATQDKAPKGPLPTTFKKVVPVKNAPLSRYGNPDSYQGVDGKTYKVMANATGYRVRGIASWYGSKFHKRKTSSGERYDMYAL